MQLSRRSVLRTLGASLAIGGAIGSASATHPADSHIRKLGHSRLSDPPGAFAESDVSDDGRLAVVGSFFGTGGSFLADISDPANITELHRLPSSQNNRQADVAFDTRDGLYYRTLEPNRDVGQGHFGFEVIDFGHDQGRAHSPAKVGKATVAGPSHNLRPHPAPDVPLLYVVNEETGTPGLEIWDVSRPNRPRRVRMAGPPGGLHDIVVDTEKEHAHCAYIFADEDAGDFKGYAILDVSDPRNPTTIGTFDYEDTPDYADADAFMGHDGFENCHFADYDPARDVAVVGDEKGSGEPGGKHLFDVSDPADPTPIQDGFFLSPHAEFMGDDENEAFDWTGHNFDVVTPTNSPTGRTLLVSGDYHEGTVVYDIHDTSNPMALDQFHTVDEADQANEPFFPVGDPPMAWDADYNAERDIVVTSDMVTGLYVFELTAP